MADHHIDYMDIDYSKAAEYLLKRYGLYIHGAPPINHKPGNDWISDVYYPFPTYPDNRFRNPSEENLDIKFPPDPPEQPSCEYNNTDNDYQILPEDLKQLRNIKNPIITSYPFDGDKFIDKSIYPYTGLVLQAVEKRAFDISYVKPYIENKKRKTRLIQKEIISGHLMSIATFDGWRYHIYRGKCITIVKTEPPKTKDGKLIRPRTVPFGNPMEETDLRKSNINEVLQKNLRIVLDTSSEFESSIDSIPINQVIDIQKYDYIYNFTIYEGGLKVFWDDWITVPDKKHEGKWFTYVPGGDILPQNLYHEVIEHQTVRKDYKG